MGTDTLTNNKGIRAELREPADDESLRKLAVERLERVRKLKVSIAGTFLGLVLLTPVWILTEYMNADGWPQRLSENSQPGDWNPWIIWVALAGLLWIGISALKVVLRPTTEIDIQREVERLRSDR